MNKLVRAAGAGVAALAVTLTTAVAASPAHADQTQANDGADWLVGQLGDDNLMPSQFEGYSDYGLSIDAGLALEAVGEHEPSVNDIRDAVAAGIDNYAAAYSYDDGSGNIIGATPSNATGKAAAFALTTGGDPTDFGGLDLISQLEKVVDNKGLLKGRLSDDPTKNGDPDPEAANYANTLGQAFAVHALDAVDSPEAPAARDFLLAQQCKGGWFRLSFSKDTKKDQSCDGDKKSSFQTDATALAIIQLESVGGKKVNTAVAKAVAWLTKKQAADGSFVDAPASSGSNANSTGLAAWALAQEGAKKPAKKAAKWLRAHQLTAASGCDFAEADLGAIAFDDAGYQAVKGSTIASAGSGDQFRRATAQALPGLLSAPAGATGTPCA